jgi:hypothetical protein
MGRKHRLVVSLALLIAGLSPIGSSARHRSDEEQKSPGENDAPAVVQNYYELAVKTDSKEIGHITTPMPKGALKKPAEPAAPEPEPPPGIAIVTATGLTKNGSLDWIRARFPKSIAENKQRIVQVYKTTVEGSFAKVWVVVGNDEKVKALPWVFLLTKEGDGKWKIYDIQTPAYAVDYLPVETNEP